MANRHLSGSWAHVYQGVERARAANGFLGLPLQANNLAERDMLPIIKKAEVRRINVHGLRLTCATLLLKAGEPAHVVQRRLGRRADRAELDESELLILQSFGKCLSVRGQCHPPAHEHRPF